MRDDTRASDEHNYQPEPGEWQSFYDEARSGGASRSDATDYADDMFSQGPSLYMQSC